ncbi:hypothetical protein ACJ73_01523 [Blastomyces percursus]|uniref:AB hydrolase-1 domain-containing protein n=1 Tax=Blastomyces percursus TaxID=1658174 RepID=A0A1J9R3X1_9EURO|nr:hypothetical protein ACJ73_01523 [Blastomyces percursus]
MAADLADLLVAEDIDTVVPSATTGAPSWPRASASAPHARRGAGNAERRAIEGMLGYASWAYWEPFTREGGVEVLESNVGRLWEVMHAARPQPEWMRELLCVRGALRAFLTGGVLGGEEVGGDLELREYAWEAMAENVYFEAEKVLAKEASVLMVPTLFVACPGDAVCRPEFIEAPKQAGLLPDLAVVR